MSPGAETPSVPISLDWRPTNVAKVCDTCLTSWISSLSKENEPNIAFPRPDCRVSRGHSKCDKCTKGRLVCRPLPTTIHGDVYDCDRLLEWARVALESPSPLAHHRSRAERLREMMIVLLENLRILYLDHRSEVKKMGPTAYALLVENRLRVLPQGGRNPTGDDLRGIRGEWHYYHQYLRCTVGDKGYANWVEAKHDFVEAVRILLRRYHVDTQDHLLNRYIVF